MHFFNLVKKNKENKTLVETWQLTCSGRVQGVGFRYSVETLARKMQLNGSVCNNFDQTVTIKLQADKDQVEAFCAALPTFLSPVAVIAHISREILPKMKQINGFHVLY